MSIRNFPETSSQQVLVGIILVQGDWAHEQAVDATRRHAPAS